MPPGAIWRPGRENAQIEPSGGLLGPFGGQGTKMLKMGRKPRNLMGHAVSATKPAIGRYRSVSSYFVVYTALQSGRVCPAPSFSSYFIVYSGSPGWPRSKCKTVAPRIEQLTELIGFANTIPAIGLFFIVFYRISGSPEWSRIPRPFVVIVFYRIFWLSRLSA